MDTSQPNPTDPLRREGDLPTDVIDQLRSQMAGTVIDPTHAEYDSARRVWNGMIDRFPVAVARCNGVADVVAAVRFARHHALPLAIRGGGHNVAGFGTCDGGLVIDLSPMRSIRVEPQSKIVRVEGGATWAEVDRETQPFGLAVPGGIVSTTGVAGLTLGGGQGWLRRTYGMTCDSLISADIVTAEGELLVVDEDHNADLLWALRGGGGNFGVVTSFEFRLHPAGPMLAFACPIFPSEDAPKVLASMRDFAENAVDELNISATWWTIPPVPDFPSELHGEPVFSLGAIYVGPPEKGERVLQPLREIAEPLLDLSGTLPYTALQKLYDPFFPGRDLRYYWKSIYLDRLDDLAVNTIAVRADARPSSQSMVALWLLGGALERVEASATATGARNAPFVLEILADWESPGDDEVNIDWTRELYSAMEPFSTGKPNLNFPGFGGEADETHAALADNWDRLVDVKRRYDPDNLFHLNQNIDPEAAVTDL